MRPTLGDQWAGDEFLRDVLTRVLPSEVRREIEPELAELGNLAGGDLYECQLQDRLNEPRLVQWDAWGNRIDQIELTHLWRRAACIAAERGLVAIPYERKHGRWSRVHQFAALYLFHPSSDLYTCPLAMADGAARTLVASSNKTLIDRALPRLIARDPKDVWISGQWMTEITGGSDVGTSATNAIERGDGSWELHGTKWFVSAAHAEMALALARPEGNGPGGSNLALFYVETRKPDGSWNGIRVERLKDKLGTRKLPTGELKLDGTIATLVNEPRNGTRAIESMLRVTRAWNSVSAASSMRRGVALARNYAKERTAFGAPLEGLPLHRETLADLEAKTRAATLLTFELVALIGRDENNEIDDLQRALLRLILPITKLLTAKQAVTVVGEAIEAFGGAGYVEDTGLPALLRDTHVLPIWEGTTNVLALDAVLRSDLPAGLEALRYRIADAVAAAPSSLKRAATTVLSSAEQIAARVHDLASDRVALQTEARRFAFTAGRALELALLIEHARWAEEQGRNSRSVEAALRFARSL